PPRAQRSEFCSQACRAPHARHAGRARCAAPRRPGPPPPGSAGRAPSKRRQAIADKVCDRIAWETAHPEVILTAERRRYAAEILPRLQERNPSLRALTEGLSVSPAYASKIRRGDAIPHPMYYARLVELLAAEGDE